jgi:hypothetical protein
MSGQLMSGERMSEKLFERALLGHLPLDLHYDCQS